MTVTKLGAIVVLGLGIGAFYLSPLSSAVGLRSESFEECLAQNDYACVVRSGYWEFVAAEQALQTSPNPENPHGHYLIGMTLAGIGEIELASRVFESHPALYERAELGGAIIARLALEEDFEELATFLSSINSPSLLGLSFGKSGHRLEYATLDAQLRTRDLFVSEVKTRIAANGVQSFFEIETLMSKGRPRQHMGVAELPLSVFSGPDTLWALDLLSQIEDPDIRARVIDNMGPFVIAQYDRLSTPEGRAVLTERRAAVLAGEAERRQQPPVSSDWQPSDITADKIAELTFSSQDNGFVGQSGRSIHVDNFHRTIFGANNLISNEDSQAFEVFSNEIDVKACRLAALTALAQAHARRGDITRSQELLNEVMLQDPQFEVPRPCRYGARLPVLILKALLGDDTALPQLFVDIERLSDEETHFSFNAALNPIDYAHVFEGLESSVTPARRVEVVSQILAFQNSKSSYIDGQAEDFALASLLDVNDPDLWLHLAREGLLQTENARDSDVQKRRTRLLGYLAANDNMNDYWFKFD